MPISTPHILLVNPWIHDFAAYDFWAKPYGLLQIAALLRNHGCSVSYIDCLDRFHPKAPASDPDARQGRGPYLKTHIPRPRGLEHLPRRYSRYGIDPAWFYADLQNLRQPDLIMVTSVMTYWYPGVREAISILRKRFADTPTILGGIYASLCREHAVKSCGADAVISGAAETQLFSLLRELTGFDISPTFKPEVLDTYPFPAFDLQHRINYVPLLTARGCPYHCAYCASHFLCPEHSRRSPASVLEEISYWHKRYAVENFVIYDDAFLIDADRHAFPILEGIARSNMKLNFHTPNAIHVRELSQNAANLLFRAGFKTLRLGLETADFDHRRRPDSKVNAAEFERAAGALKSTGFRQDQVGAYLLVGLPGQRLDSIRQSIQTVIRSGMTPIPAYYSPIPHTALWQQAKAASRYDLESDPIFTNNAILPCHPKPFSWKMLSDLKTQTTPEACAQVLPLFN